MLGTDGRMHLQLRFDRDRATDGNWTRTLSAGELHGLAPNANGDVAFKLEREAGTMSLRGRFEERRGAGHFTFEEAPGFRKQMASLGYAGWTDEEIFVLFSTDVGPSRVKALRELGYRAIPKEKLIEVGLFDVTPESIRAYARAGYSNLTLEELIKLRMHGIDAAWIDRVRGELNPPSR